MDYTDAVNQRIIEFLKKITDNRSEGGQAGLAKRLGFTRGFISQVINGHDLPSRKLLNSLVKLYPEAETFIFGSRVTEQNELAPNARRLPELKNQMAIHLVHERAHAGYATMWSDREWLEDLPTVFMDERKDGKYVAFEVVGDSMECESSESIKEGDIIIAKELQQHHWTNKLHVPGIFVIVLNGTDKSGVWVKEVIRHDTAKGILTCHSFNSYHADEEVNLKDVVKLYYAWEHRKRMRRR